MFFRSHEKGLKIENLQIINIISIYNPKIKTVYQVQFQSKIPLKSSSSSSSSSFYALKIYVNSNCYKRNYIYQQEMKNERNILLYRKKVEHQNIVKYIKYFKVVPGNQKTNIDVDVDVFKIKEIKDDDNEKDCFLFEYIESSYNGLSENVYKQVMKMKENGKFFSIEKVRKYTRQIFSVIKYFRENGIICTSISPYNFIIDIIDDNIKFFDYSTSFFVKDFNDSCVESTCYSSYGNNRRHDRMFQSRFTMFSPELYSSLTVDEIKKYVFELSGLAIMICFLLTGEFIFSNDVDYFRLKEDNLHKLKIDFLPKNAKDLILRLLNFRKIDNLDDFCCEFYNHPFFLNKFLWTKENHMKFQKEFRSAIEYFIFAVKYSGHSILSKISEDVLFYQIIPCIGDFCWCINKEEKT